MEDDDLEEGAPVEIPISDSIDLHAFLPRDVKSVVYDYLVEARARGYLQVRLVHGRGIGVQREIVRSLLTAIPWVIAFSDADPSGGGWGATVVSLEADSPRGPAERPDLG
ncbi:MAG: Smr/MutS family protein [Thermoanaerobaculia bacterium]|nr:Smr/MutS family protein [Thermoanaerobaculia bacterium]